MRAARQASASAPGLCWGVCAARRPGPSPATFSWPGLRMDVELLGCLPPDGCCLRVQQGGVASDLLECTRGCRPIGHWSSQQGMLSDRRVGLT